jgi:hypothetical protein
MVPALVLKMSEKSAYDPAALKHFRKVKEKINLRQWTSDRLPDLFTLSVL